MEDGENLSGKIKVKSEKWIFLISHILTFSRSALKFNEGDFCFYFVKNYFQIHFFFLKKRSPLQGI